MKNELHDICISLAKNKMNALEQELTSMRLVVQSESKSSAGDKHETGRAMIHLEQEKLQKQLTEAQQLVLELEKLKSEQRFDIVQNGALVKTNHQTFYVAAGLGKIQNADEDVFVISSQSPIAKQMLGKRTSENFSMNGTEYVIVSIE